MLDSHCHLNDEILLPNLEVVISSALISGVTTILCVGYDLESSKKAVEIAEAHQGIFAAVGYQPENVKGVDLSVLNEIEKLASSKKVIAIGEIGFDYHWEKTPEIVEHQKEFFIAQLKLAKKLNLPVSIHARDATQDTYDILKEYLPSRSGVLHCYSGSKEMLLQFSKLGLYFGFGGTSTYINAASVRENIAICPKERILSETDSPYLTPVPFRGKTNEPKHVPLIVANIAKIEDMTLEECEKLINKNFEKLFHVEL